MAGLEKLEEVSRSVFGARWSWTAAVLCFQLAVSELAVGMLSECIGDDALSEIRHEPEKGYWTEPCFQRSSTQVWPTKSFPNE